jgi:hypothetical protein
MEELVAEGGYATATCSGWGCRHVVRFYSDLGPTHCRYCIWLSFVMDNFPEYWWDPMHEALEELGPHEPLVEYVRLAERILWAHR